MVKNTHKASRKQVLVSNTELNITLFVYKKTPQNNLWPLHPGQVFKQSYISWFLLGQQ